MLLAICAEALLLTANYYKYRTLLHPLVLIPGFWFFLSLVATLNYGLQTTWIPILLIFTSCLIASIIMYWNPAPNKELSIVRVEAVRLAIWLPFLAFFSAITAGLIAQFSLSLDPISGFWSNGKLVYVAGYSEESRVSWLIPLLLSVTYFGALVTPFVKLGGKFRRWQSWNYALPIIGIGYYGLATGSRNGLVLVLVMLSASKIVKALLDSPKRKTIHSKDLAIWSFSGLFVFFMIAAATLSRSGGVATEGLKYYFTNSVLYLSGGFSALGIWLDQTSHQLISFGWSSYSGLVPGVLGAGTSRAYETSVIIATEISTNIYTGFRSLIEDFGIFGTVILVAFILVMLSQLVRQFNKQQNLFFVSTIVAGTTFLIYLPFSSLLSWTATAVALIAFSLSGPKLLRLRNIDISERNQKNEL